MSRKPKTGHKVTPMPTQTATAVAEPESDTDPETPFDGPPPNPIPPNRRGRPPGNPGPPAKPRQMSFMERVEKIDKSDWGTRAKIKIYRLEPIIDRLRGSEFKYLTIYHEPVTEEKIKLDHGSGRYRLYLNFKAAAQQDKEIDQVEIDILDTNFPPKVPPGEWVDDPRNKKYAWAKPVMGVPQQQQAPAQNSTEVLVDALRISKEIRQDTREELQANTPPPTDALQQFTGIVGAIKGLFPAPPPASDNAVLTTIVTLMQAQIAASQKQTENAQNEAKELRQQIFQLIKEQKGANNDGIENWIEKLDKLAPKLQNLLGLAGEKATEVVHGRRREWWQDILISVAPPLANSLAPVLPMLAGAFMGARPGQQQPALQANGNGARPPAAPGQPAVAAAAPQPGQPNPIEQAAARVGQYLTVNMRPMQTAFESFLKGEPRDTDEPDQGKVDGSDFAAWIMDNHGPEILADARSLGSGNILQMFRTSPYWPALQAHEAKLLEFLDGIIRFDPSDYEEENPAAEEKGVIVTPED